MPDNLVDHLNAEWDALAADPRNELAEWAQSCPALADSLTLPDVIRNIRREPDTVLTFLIGRYQARDELAGRTILQAMLGKLVRMSYTGVAANEPDSLDDLVTQMWCQISRYPLGRRPHRVAANLALDSYKAAYREWTKHGEIPVPTAVVVDRLEELAEREPAPDEFDWTAEFLIQSAHRLRLITDTTRDILVAVYADGLSGADAAHRWNCSPAAIRTRCRTAVTEQLTPLAHRLIAA